MTAEENIEKILKEITPIGGNKFDTEFLKSVPLLSDLGRKVMKNAAIQFAKYHVEKALEAAKNDSKLLLDGEEHDYSEYTIEDYDTFYKGFNISVKDISNSYPLENIK